MGYSLGQWRRAYRIDQAIDQRLLRPDHDEVDGLVFTPRGELVVILKPREAHREPGDLVRQRVATGVLDVCVCGEGRGYGQYRWPRRR